MNGRLLTGVMGAFCAVGLAAAGIGWRGQEASVPPAHKVVYCNVQAMMKYHPAWEQYTQLLRSRPSAVSAGDAVAVESGAAVSDLSRSVSLPHPGLRSELRKQVEARGTEELAKYKGRMLEALDARLVTLKQDLVAAADAQDAVLVRDSEDRLAANIRRVAESQEYESVDSAVKLAALKAQLSAPGVSPTVKSAIEVQEGRVKGLQVQLLRAEEGLRSKSESGLSAAKVARQAQIDAAVARVRDAELPVIEARVAGVESRLRRDMDSSVMSSVESRVFSRSSARLVRAGAGATEGPVVSRARMQYSSAAKSAQSIPGEAEELRSRMQAELVATVKRIARENGVEVTFFVQSGVKDSTDWFRSRLPYATAVTGTGRTRPWQG